MPQTLNEIADRLAASGLLTVGEIAILLAGVPAERPQTAEEFVQTLTKRGALTDYQAECIVGGRIDHLVLGNYVVLDKLGQGGMGLVLKARHRRMDRLVALKVLSPELIRSSTAVERFQREVRAAAKLSHPNIVTAYDADEHYGTHFLVMEFVEGRDLSSIVKEHGPFSVPMAVNCIVQAAVGLEYAHQQGVVHRDIKPGNLILVAGQVGNLPQLKVLDMGLARIESASGAVVDRELTATGSVLGTIDYMSPEQALDTKLADARSDIYSLGCSLFYLLTGQTMYSGDTVMRRLLAHRESLIPDLSALRPDITSAMQMAFSKMVAKQPRDRFQTMTEVIQSFVALQHGLGPASDKELLANLCGPSASKSPGTSTSGIPGVPPLPQSSSLAETVLLRTESSTQRTHHASDRSWRLWGMGGVAAALALIGAWIWQTRSGAATNRTSEQKVPLATTHFPDQTQSRGEEPPVPAIATTHAARILDPDRRVAEWVLDRHGSVWIDGQDREYLTVADLPNRSFKTTLIQLLDLRAGLDDDSLKNLIGLDGLKRLTLYDNHRVTDVGIAHLKELPNLEHLGLRDTRMTDDGLKYFAAMNRLETLMLEGPQITDNGLGHLNDCKQIRALHLKLPQTTDQGLQHIQSLLQRLRILGIRSSRVSDAGLARLGELQNLEQLGLNDLAISNDGLKHLQGLKDLVVLNLACTPISDAGLIHLRGLLKLQELALEETQVTAAGVAELQAALPKCAIRF